MLRNTVSRIRLSLCALGCAVLGASLVNWVQTLPAAAQRETWVSIGSSNAPAVETAEVWRVSGRCVRPYFERALLRSKERLKAYYALAPEAVRARLDRAAGPQSSAEPGGWYHLVNDAPGVRPRETPDKEFVAELHVEYAEWYANVFKLEVEANQWQQRLKSVADQQVVLGESARRSFGAYSAHGAQRPKDGFDHHVLTTLGLGGFPGDVEQALKSDCVNIDLVKKIVQYPNTFGQLWRWPVDQTAAFAIGLELIFLAIFLVPITLWIGTGDTQIAWRHMRDTVDRMAAGIRSFDREKFVSNALRRAHAIESRTRVVLANFRSGAVRQLGLWRRMAASPNFTIDPMHWGDGETGGDAGVISTPPHPSPEYRQPW